LENLELGQVELLTFADPVRPGPGVEPPRTGSMMLSFFVDLEKVLPAVEAFGGTDVRRSTLKNGTAIASVRDPDGVLVELLDAARRAGS
jgi:predicted enzyme related to lactoylglutathione lyase